MTFHDVVEITVQGGKGGDGCMSMLRLKYVPRGGPDGGNGGEGGSVYLEAVSDVTSLNKLLGKHLFKANVGKQGEGRNKSGAKGADLTIYVPVGTAAYDIESGELIADLIEIGGRKCVARGGLGGRGNAAFANSRNRTPRFAELGTLGEKRKLRLELRLIANAGLVGYPNAGKSSLLAVLSNAKPQIAAYPFTTLSPNLGVLESGIAERLTLADIPGIIEGAAEGKGLGLEFLRHISRTNLLIYVIDVNLAPKKTLQTLQSELQAYDTKLLNYPAAIVLNKIDLVKDINNIINEMTEFGLPILTTSTLNGQGLTQLKDTLFELLSRKKIIPLTKPVTKIKVEPTAVTKVAGGWLVTGEEVQRTVNRFNTTNSEAVAYLQHRFKEWGVNKLLKQKGAIDGEDVFIGEAVFEYFDEEKMKQDSAINS